MRSSQQRIEETSMNRNAAYLPGNRDDSWFGFFSNALIWLLFAAAGLLLMWFVSVLNDVTQRGEQRRLQQRTTGSLILADEAERRSRPVAAVLTASTEASTLR
jgi:hypothetical protein